MIPQLHLCCWFFITRICQIPVFHEIQISPYYFVSQFALMCFSGPCFIFLISLQMHRYLTCYITFQRLLSLQKETFDEMMDTDLHLLICSESSDQHLTNDHCAVGTLDGLETCNLSSLQ